MAVADEGELLPPELQEVLDRQSRQRFVIGEDRIDAWLACEGRQPY